MSSDAAAEPKRVGALVVACFAVGGPHIPVKQSSNDGEAVTRIFVFVKELVVSAEVESGLEPLGFASHPFVVAQGRLAVDGVFKPLEGVGSASRKFSPSVFAPGLAVTVGEVADIDLVVGVLDELSSEVTVDRVPCEPPEACSTFEPDVSVVLVYALPSYFWVPCECYECLGCAGELDVETG